MERQRRRRSADLPTFDGELAYDSATRQAAASDWGREIHRPPTAVLKPTSATDIARLVTYANKHHLKIAMRGQGHSVCGQAQVLGGIVIDSSTLNSVRWQGKDQLDANRSHWDRWGALRSSKAHAQWARCVDAHFWRHPARLRHGQTSAVSVRRSITCFDVDS